MILPRFYQEPRKTHKLIIIAENEIIQKIRQALLNTGSLRRYLIYALGEILLIVIGILLLKLKRQTSSIDSNLKISSQ